MSVQAKLMCESVLRTDGTETVNFRAVSGPGNEEWSKWTPSASFQMTVTNPDVFGEFNPGTSYSIFISEAE